MNIQYIHFDTLDSTNNWVKSNAAHLDPHAFTCITALEQTAGRGRFARKWFSPRAQNIYATLFFTLPKTASYLNNVGQVLAYACAVLLKGKGFSVQLKWPNDILVNGKKIAGILMETTSLKDSVGIILGIGLNVNMSDELLKTIDQPATSLSQLSAQTWEMEQVLEPLLQQFLTEFQILKVKGFSHFRPLIDELLAFKGEKVSCHDGSRIVKGICHSINEEGRLKLILPSGKVTTLSAGELKD